MVHEFDGKKYEEASIHQKEWGAKLIAELDLKGTEHVLDLGCGDGALTLQMAELLPQGTVTGIDASQGMIAAAIPKSRNNLRFLLMNINELNFDQQFDLIFSNAALHWVKNHERLLKSTHQLLRIDGRLRFNFAGNGNCSHFFKVIQEAMALDEFSSYFTQFKWPWYMPSVGEYQSLVESSGLTNTRIWGENADRYFPNQKAMIDWIDQPSLVPFLYLVPSHHKEAFRIFVIKRMIEETKKDDGRCFETFRRINLSATK